jgi:hypothetical protein
MYYYLSLLTSEPHNIWRYFKDSSYAYFGAKGCAWLFLREIRLSEVDSITTNSAAYSYFSMKYI